MSTNGRETATGTTEAGEVGPTVGVGESKEDPALRNFLTARNVGLAGVVSRPTGLRRISGRIRRPAAKGNYSEEVGYATREKVSLAR